VELFLQSLPVSPIQGKYPDLRRRRNLSAYMNPLKSYREKLFLSKAELARKAGISTLTIDRAEKGKSCRLETKRKIILALGLTLSEGEKIFGNGK
jgi:DNA-binding XRE family transcriptional regulator